MTTDSSSELRVYYAQRCDKLHAKLASKYLCTVLYEVYTLFKP